jgi:DNA polymerase III alpha subunit
MRTNNLGQSVFDSNDLINMIYQGHVNKLLNVIVEQDTEILEFQQALGAVFQTELADIDQNTFDQNNQKNWAMPREYRDLDIEAWIYDQGPPWNPEHARIQLELEEFRQRNMIDLLRWLKYFVDTCRTNNIVWGVGRGSSVASYVLYLIGVHKIDSIKYNLDFSEFMR